MDNKLMLKFTALTLATTLSSILVATSTSQVKAASVSDTYISGSIKADNVKIISNDVIEIDGVKYSLSSISDAIKKDINSNPGHAIQPRSVQTKAIKVAFKWVVDHSATIYKHLPAGLKKYFKVDAFIKVARQFLGVSDTVENFFHKSFRAMGMPETVNWAITNIIMALGPF
jgi:hypothetical protein